MANCELLEKQREKTRLVIEELLGDGSDPGALYTIEHHLSSDKFEILKEMAAGALKLGYEVTSPEKLEVENGSVVTCCDAISKIALKAELIDAQVEQLMDLVENGSVHYDGWGTYFEGKDFVDENSNGKRHCSS